MNTIPDTRYPILKLLLLTILIYGLLIIDYELTYAQTEKLEVDGDLEIQSTESDTTPAVPLRHGLIFKPFTTPPAPGSRGQIYYDGNEDKKMLRYHNNTPGPAGWVDLGSGPAAQDKYVATRIVAAYNSLGSTVDGSPPIYNPSCTNCCAGNGSACNNPKADTGYTCDGLNDQETINNAITEVGNRGGGAVYLLEGTFNIAKVLDNISGIIFYYSDVALIGTGAGTVLKISADVTDTFHAIFATSKNILISQLRLFLESTTCNGITLQGNNSRIDKVWFQGKYKDYVVQIMASNNTISNCTFSDMTKPAQKDILIRRYTVSGFTQNKIYNNIFEDNARMHILIEAGTDNIIAGNNLVGAQGESISIDSNYYCYDCGAAGNRIIQNNLSNSGGGICLYTKELDTLYYSPHSNIITGNNIEDCGTLCLGNMSRLSCYNSGTISLCLANANIVSNNLLYKGNINLGMTEGPFFYTKDNLVSGNLVYDSLNASGIQYQGNAKANLLSFNHISNPTKKNIGINGLSVDATDTYIMGNFIDHATVLTPLVNSSNLNKGAMYTQREKMTLERSDVFTVSPWPGNIIRPVNHPTGYIPVKSQIFTGRIKAIIAYGESKGDILILEGTDDTDYVYIELPGCDVFAPCTLQKNDILKLLWSGCDNGACSGWKVLGYSDNRP